MAVSVPKGNLVDQWMQGNVTVKVYDGAYADKTPEEAKRIHDRIMHICRECLEVASAVGKDI